MKKTLLGLSLVAPIMATAADFYVPDTISKEGQAFLSTQFTAQLRQESAIPDAMTKEDWLAMQAKANEDIIPLNTAVVEKYKPTLKEMTLGGVGTLEIKPYGWKDNGKLLVYVHGGAYISYNSRATLASSVPVAHDTGLRVVSIDYTLAPMGNYKQATDDVIAVIDALRQQGYNMNDIAIYGDSAGGGLVAGSVLKMRDQNKPLPAAVVLWSPWADITETGDTYYTLKDAEPLYRYDLLLKPSADAYANTEDQKHPYVSPVYGDYSKPFPPTLIQAGTKEIFLSNAVRLYQAIDSHGGEAKLDIYEGMWHVFQAFSFDIPEAHLARRKMSQFLDSHL